MCGALLCFKLFNQMGFFSSGFFRLKTVFEPPQTLTNKTVFTTEFLVIINFRIILLTPPFYKNLIL